jgi:hypothetical protein
MQSILIQQNILPSKPHSLIKEAANYVGTGILKQEEGDFTNAKPLIKEGIEKIKKVLIKDNSSEKEIIFEYVIYYI